MTGQADIERLVYWMAGLWKRLVGLEHFEPSANRAGEEHRVTSYVYDARQIITSAAIRRAIITGMGGAGHLCGAHVVLGAYDSLNDLASAVCGTRAPAADQQESPFDSGFCGLFTTHFA